MISDFIIYSKFLDLSKINKFLIILIRKQGLPNKSFLQYFNIQYTMMLTTY